MWKDRGNYKNWSIIKELICIYIGCKIFKCGIGYDIVICLYFKSMNYYWEVCLVSRMKDLFMIFVMSEGFKIKCKV